MFKSANLNKFIKHFKYISSPLKIQKAQLATIVERVYPPDIPDHVSVENYDMDRSCYVYRVLEKTEDKDWGNIDVILTEDVETLGYKGEIVSVPRIDFYSYLSPCNIALYPTERNLKKFEEERKLLTTKIKLSPFSLHTQKTMENLILKIPIIIKPNEKLRSTTDKAHLTKDLIRLLLRKNNIITSNDDIILSESTFPIDEQFTIPIKINHKCTVNIKCILTRMTEQQAWDEFSDERNSKPL